MIPTGDAPTPGLSLAASEGDESRLGLRERLEQLEPQQRIWLLVGAGLLTAIGGLVWWFARKRAATKCKPVLEWDIYGAKVIVEQCPVADGFIFLGEIPEQKVEGVVLDPITSPAFHSTADVRAWAKAKLQERLG